MEIDLQKLKHLLVIARTGNFSRAAEELHITQPALSRSVAGLEQRYGFRIFDRSRSGVSPTALGKLVLANAESLIRDAGILERNLRLYGDGDAGKVAFGMGPLIACWILAELSANTLAERPQLHMRCSIKSADMLLLELMSNEIEMMFCTTGQISPSPEIEITPVGIITLGVIARSGHPLATQKNPKLNELSAYPFACAVELHSKHWPTKSGALICDNYEIMRQVVLKGDTIWLSSLEMVADDLAAGRLIEISFVDMPVKQSEVNMVRLKGRTSSPAAISIASSVVKLLSGKSLA